MLSARFDVGHISAALEQRHSLLAQCQQHIVCLKPLHEVPTRLLNTPDVGEAPPKGLFGLLAVGLEDRDVRIFEEVVELGVDSHGLFRLTGKSGNLMDEILDDDSLVVIFKNDGVEGGKLCPQGVKDLRQYL